MPKSKVHRRGPARPELNMTPLIDVTFQLIIFFMLISNFIAEETVEMIVPVLHEPKVHEFDEMTRVVVSIAPLQYGSDDRDVNHLDWTGEAEFVRVGASPVRYRMDEMARVSEELAARVAAAPRDAEDRSVLEVLLRADAALYYDAVQPVMAAITQAGVSKVHLVSYLPNHGPRVRGGEQP